MNWTIEFLPLVSWPVFWGLAALGFVLFGLLLWRSRRGAILRALSYACLLLAIANPQLKQEDREPLNDVLAVVVDDSQSQTTAGRDQRTATVVKELGDKLKAFPNLDVRWVHSASTSSDGERDGTMLFTDLGKALADVPPDRLAGTIMITDGNVHDVPGSAAALGFDAPVHALLTGKPGEFDRRLEVLKAPRFGLVGNEQEIEVKVSETVPSKQSARNTHHHPSGRDARRHEVSASARQSTSRSRSITPARISSRSRPRGRLANSPRRTTAPSSPSKACVRICVCCWCRASRMPASAPGATC